MKIQNWAGTTVPLNFDSIYSQLKYYLATMPKEIFFPRMAERPMTQYIRTNLKGELVGVEIGVHVARNSFNMMRMLPIKHLYCIDPYTKYDQEGSAANSNTDTKFIERTAHKRLKRFGNKITWIQDYSGLAADRVPDGVDFVYIDGNHTYENVVEDIELYYPKVKNGGIIGGHDFDGSNKGVCRAAIEFADKKGFELHGGKIDWWIIKRENE